MFLAFGITMIQDKKSYFEYSSASPTLEYHFGWPSFNFHCGSFNGGLRSPKLVLKVLVLAFLICHWLWLDGFRVSISSHMLHAV